MDQGPPETLEDLVARAAPDRYVAALFAPPARREALIALYAFDHEVARIAEVAHEPMVGHIRLAWWREQIAVIYAGGTVQAPVARALSEAVHAYALPREPFDAYLDARVHDLEEAPFADERALERYAVAVSGGIMRLGVRVLGAEARGDGAARHAGVAFDYARILAKIGTDARLRHCRLPLDWLEGAGLSAEDVFSRQSAPALRGVAARVATAAGDALAALSLQSFPPQATAVLASAATARWMLACARRSSFDPYEEGRAPPAWQRVARIALANLTWRI